MSGGAHRRSLRGALVARDGVRFRTAHGQYLQIGWCFWCDVRLDGPDITADHLVRKAAGGSSELANLVIACEPCNSSRHWDYEDGEPPFWVEYGAQNGSLRARFIG